MFSKAKRFELLAKNQTKDLKKLETDNHKPKCVVSTPAQEKNKPEIGVSKIRNIKTPVSKPKPIVPSTTHKNDVQSQCSSNRSVKSSFMTPKHVQAPTTLKKPFYSVTKNADKKITTQEKVSDDIIKSQQVEIRNKDYTISEYNKQIEELKNEIASLHNQLKTVSYPKVSFNVLNKKLSEIHPEKVQTNDVAPEANDFTKELNDQISALQQQCDKLEKEVSAKQVELTSLEQIICIRDSLCKDLQDKLTTLEMSLEETRQRLEMVKGHHALALEANESIRREYKVELETMKAKLEEEKQGIINKCKMEQESLRAMYNTQIESIKTDMLKEKDDVIYELEQKIQNKDREMKAKLEQMDEATYEKLRICEIQFEERYKTIQEHWSAQEEKIQYYEKEINELKYSLKIAEDKSVSLQKELKSQVNQNELLDNEKHKLIQEVEELKDESKMKLIDFENQINKLMVEVDKAVLEKKKYEISLNVTRDIVHVLTTRLRESDDEVENLEGKIQIMKEEKDKLVDEITSYKTMLDNTTLECNEYKDALVNILKSKAALAKEHNRIMEHNVTLIESLQNVEKEAYRELGSIKSELIEDVELLKLESSTQIKMLREEVEKKRVLCELAKEHASQATAAAEQSRVLLSHAAAEISRLEGDSQRLTGQIQDQQSLVVELSLLRQENEELAVTVAKQSSIIEKMKKDMEQKQTTPKSPSVIRKNHKLGKENTQIIISPLRERNH